MSMHLPHDCLCWAESLTTKNGHLQCFLTTLPLEQLKTAPGTEVNGSCLEIRTEHK